MKWYPVSFVGGLVTGLYSWSIVFSLLYYDLVFSVYLARGMFWALCILVIILCAYAIIKRKTIFERKNKKRNSGFTLLELLIVISIMGLITTFIFPTVLKVRNKAILVKATKEFESIHQSVQFYLDDYGDWPDDTSRNVPPGLETYLAPGIWPEAAWPDSVFDWENWVDPETGDPIYQISVRFCPIGGSLSSCKFPKETWAEDFGVNSAVYYCIEGSCRSHISQSIDYPGYCVNCTNN